MLASAVTTMITSTALGERSRSNPGSPVLGDRPPRDDGAAAATWTRCDAALSVRHRVKSPSVERSAVAIVPSHDDPDRAARRARHPARHDPGRARPAARPLRREGPAKLTGTAKYTDDLVVPGRLVRGDDPLDRRARARSTRSTSTPRSTGRRSSSSPRPTSPATTSSARSRPTSRSWSRSAARSSTTPSRWPCSPPRTGPPCARRVTRSTPRTTQLPAGLRSARVRPRLRRLRRIERGDPDAAFAAADLILEGEYRVGHQEQLYIENNAMIAVPTDGRRRHRHGLAPMPVLRPRRAQARPRHRRPARRGSSRRRPAAGSVARRSSPRSSRSTPRSSPARPSARSA